MGIKLNMFTHQLDRNIIPNNCIIYSEQKFKFMLNVLIKLIYNITF